eukprot:CAMPEP_0176462002 /NCGR_PEP_ID=MMETSP0127-20121128/34995_1 /TAXON_ID=938130 /ORGANISM="Platyophrya macrostoma, Strain WH" /LENGTH=349 /DNA_ID=CAMNT_0017853811 /DNA_START=208 /DNA_END=1257 /DNA_ORIENTATION=-
MTAINIPEMVKIPRYHGLIPVPVEISFNELKPNVADIEAKITPKTKCIMVSYLYGCEYDITEIIKVAKKHNIFVIEDAAESFHGPQHTGHPDADLSMYSFGTIKILTAYGGSMTIVRNNDALYRKMQQIQETYPKVGDKLFWKKSLKNAVPLIALNSHFVNRAVRYIINEKLGIDHRELVVSLIRGFPDEPGFLGKFRKQVPVAMLVMLLIRLKAFNSKDFENKTQNLRDAMNNLVKGGVKVPGSEAKDRHFWLYPITTPDKDEAFNILQARGLDVYKRSTQLRLVESPVGSKYEFPEKTNDFFDRLLYLPLHHEVPREDLMAMTKEIIDGIKELNTVKASKMNRQSKL